MLEGYNICIVEFKIESVVNNHFENTNLDVECYMDRAYKNKIFNLIVAVVVIGAIVPFATQFVLPFFFPRCKIVGAEVWNQYVSIILGVVATILSVVSLVLGFKSEEESHKTELRTRDLLNHLEGKIELMSQKQDQIQFSLLKNFSEAGNAVSVSLTSGSNNPNDEQLG